MISTVENIMERYSCDAERAQRYIDLRDEGYPMHQALLMAGLSDPPEPADKRAAPAPNPTNVTVNGRGYSVYFHRETGEPHCVETTVRMQGVPFASRRLSMHGPTAKAAINAASAVRHWAEVTHRSPEKL